MRSACYIPIIGTAVMALLFLAMVYWTLMGAL